MSKQLVSIIKEFQVWNYYSFLNQRLEFVDASRIPFIVYPNGVPCIEANLYMQAQIHKGLSRRVKGGTLTTYAKNISHLVRYIYKNNINFSRLTDDRYSMFIQGLQGERNAVGKLVRKNNHVIKIGRQCIDFLIFVADFYDIDNLIGTEKNNAIRVFEKKHRIHIEGRSKPKEVNYYWHQSLPTPDAEYKRHPISNDAEKALKAVIDEQKDIDIRRRDRCIYQALEQTGARRTELAMLRVEDVKKALDSYLDYPLLRLITLKRKDSKTERKLPVPRIFLNNLDDYIRTSRRRIIKKTIGKENDHGYLFVSHKKGTPLTPDTITTMIHTWRKRSGIEEAAFAHLFRHAFITEKLKEIILQHDIDTKDEFRKALLNTERFKMQLQQWTGHTHLSSLDTYIDLVFAELAGSRESINTTILKASVSVMQSDLDALMVEINKGEMKITEIVQSLESSLEAFQNDILSSKT